MRYLRVLRVLLLLSTLFFAAFLPSHACGRERWDAKVLSGGVPLFTSISATDVSSLSALPRPFGVSGADAPRVTDERRIYKVQGELLGFKLEDDGDIHLVIAQPGDRSTTLVAEIPDPNCMAGAPTAYVQDVAQARLAFVKRYGIPPYRSMRLAYQPITITGPLFFDFEHGQSGSAPNDAEIHPVLSIGDSSVAAATARSSQYPIHTAHASYRGSTPAESPSGSASCSGEPLVWVNSKTGIYHFPGTRWYGTTKRGMYLCESAANAQGYRPARNE